MRVVTVNDNPVAVSARRAVLASNSSAEVLEVWDGVAGYSVYFDRMPDVAIINLNFAGSSGVGLVRRILQRKSKARISTCTMDSDPVLADQAIEIGAMGYVADNDELASFSCAVRSIAEGRVFLRSDIAGKVAFLRASAKAATTSNLKPWELKVLRLMATGRTITEIAEECGLSSRTSANSRTGLKQKLGARGTADLLRTAIEWRL